MAENKSDIYMMVVTVVVVVEIDVVGVIGGV